MEKTEKAVSRCVFLNIGRWRAYFEGRGYPLLVAALVLFGNLTALDYYVNFIVTGLFIFAMLICDSIKPGIITFLSYIYQISLPHAPGYPTYSDFFFSEWRVAASVIIIILVAFAFLFFFFKKKIYRRLTKKETPFLYSLIAFSSALIMNGISSEDWIVKDLIFAILNVLVYFFLFLAVYHGFSEREKAKEIMSYFCYISLLIAMMIICEMLFLFITSDVVSIEGMIIKERVALGWGIWNIIGQSLSVLIPVLFYGAIMENRYYVYFSVASLCYLFAILSMSRNALICSSFAYFSSLAVASFFGERRRLYRIVSLFLLAAVAIAVLIFYGEIRTVLFDYFDRGLSDNGRFALWRLAIQTFADHPLFGNGFYGLITDAVFEYSSFPRMAHNTFFQILSSMGLFGLASYLWYRAETLLLFLRRPSIMKSMLGISIAAFLLGSLLDNFVFNIHPAIYYTIALAIACKAHREKG